MRDQIERETFSGVDIFVSLHLSINRQLKQPVDPMHRALHGAAISLRRRGEAKDAFRWERLYCIRIRDNQMRLELNALACNLATFLRSIDLPEAMPDCSLTSFQFKLIKIRARVVRNAHVITFQRA